VILVTAHVPESDARRMALALGPDVELVTLQLNGLSEVYRQYATAHPLTDVVLAALPDGYLLDGLVLVGWSAGCSALRVWLGDAEDRAMVRAAVFLDGVHAPGPPCAASTLEPLVQYAEEGGVLVVTHTDIVPPGYSSTTDCAKTLRPIVGDLPNVLIRRYPGGTASDHIAQVRQHGEELLRTFVLGRLSGGGGSTLTAVVTVAALLGAGLLISKLLR